MKTVIYDPVADLVVNVGMGEPSNSAPVGLEYIVVEDDVFVGPGCKRAVGGTFYMPSSEGPSASNLIPAEKTARGLLNATQPNES